MPFTSVYVEFTAESGFVQEAETEHRLTIGVVRQMLSGMIVPRLGDLEVAVLELAWRLGEVDVKDAHRQIGEPRGITSNTVQSTLERLFRKGLLSRERLGHAYVYTPAITRDEFRARAAATAAGELRGAQASGVLAAFVEIAAKVDKKNLDRLESIVAAARARRERGE